MKNFLLEARRYMSSLTLLTLKLDWEEKLLAVSQTVVAILSEMSACNWELVNACFGFILSRGTFAY